MRRLFERFATRQEYRHASITLIGATMLPVLFLLSIEPTKADLAFAFGIALFAYFALAILTYFRLQDALRSIWWLTPMLVVFPIGPMWTVESWEWGSIGIAPLGVVTLLPVVIGWFAAGTRVK